MIFVISGKNGSGKTYQMVRMVLSQWISGVDIYSNTPLYFERYFGKAGCTIKDSPKSFMFREKIFDKIKYLYSLVRKNYQYIPAHRGRIVYFEDVQDLVPVVNAVVLIDEGQALFSSRGWESLPRIIQWKFQQHRKDGLDLYTTTPNMARIDVIYRELVHHWFQQEEIFSIGSVWFGLFRTHVKDIDFLLRSVDEAKIPDLKTKIFWLHFRKPRLYDTNFKIGFKYYKIIWLSKSINKKIVHKIYLMPKEMNLSQALTYIRSFKYV